MIHFRLFDSLKNSSRELFLEPENMPDQVCQIGRAPTSALVLDSPEVSRLHGEVSYRNCAYYFADAGSAGGSWLDNKAVFSKHQYELTVGSLLVIGHYTLAVIQIGDTDSTTEICFVPVAKSLTPEQYMPVSVIDPNSFTRWQKGDLKVRCAEIINETHDVKTFRFVAEPGLLFSYKPGQFLTLDLEINGQEVLRSYSISSSPSRPHSLEITVKRVPAATPDLPDGLVSNWLHDNIRVGSEVKISGPMGKFTCFQYPSQKLLFISAGSGVTPMMGMSRWLCDTMADCDVVFLHSARTPADVIYQQELMMMSARHQKFHPLVTVTQNQPGQNWLGLNGRVTASMLKLVVPDFMERVAFVCGPEPFMAGTKKILEELNFPIENYHEESFGGAKPAKSAVPKSAPLAPQSAPVASVAPPAIGGGGLRSLLKLDVDTPPEPAGELFPSVQESTAAPTVDPMETIGQITIIFSKSDQSVVCDGEESILEVADAQGVKIRSSCRSGNCGTCKKRKLEGRVRMGSFDPEALEEDEQAEGFILTCVAYPQGRVVIEA
jgi:glycine betaine catabolism B